MQANLPKLAGTLESLILFKVRINHLCVNALAYLLKFSLSQLALVDLECAISSKDYEHLTNAIIKSELKQLKLTAVEIDHVMGNSLAQLLTQAKTLKSVNMIGCRDIDCGDTVLLLEALSHSSNNVILAIDIFISYKCRHYIKKYRKMQLYYSDDEAGTAATAGTAVAALIICCCIMSLLLFQV